MIVSGRKGESKKKGGEISRGAELKCRLLTKCLFRADVRLGLTCAVVHQWPVNDT